MRHLIFILTIFASILLSLTAMGQQKVEVIVASPGYPPEDNELSMCSLGCAMGWLTTASSHLPPQGKNKYDVLNIDDFRIDTAWIEGVEGYGIGESITFKFPKEAFDEAKIKDKINFNGFILVNGYCKNKQTWQDNSRVKRVLIAHNGRPLFEAKFHNSMNIQRVYIDNIYLKSGDTVRVTILEVYRGDKYKDTAISELVPTGAH